jgi:hypothetical protein
LSIRHHVAAVGRQVATLCKSEDGLRHQLALYHCYYNFWSRTRWLLIMSRDFSRAV